MGVELSPECPSQVVDGPWSSGFVMRAPLTLRSKSNFRRHRVKASSGSWGETQSFERSLALLLRASRPPGWEVGDPGAPVLDRPVVVAVIAARSVLDVANFSKSVLDAGEGVLYVSDASVLGETSVGVRVRSSELFVGFAQLPPGSPPLQVVEALNTLSALVVPLIS
jgi:hypothetical protein